MAAFLLWLKHDRLPFRRALLGL